MVRLIEYLSRFLPRASGAGRWDDTGVEDVVAALASLAEADGTDDDAPRASASRAAVLGAFAAYQATLQPGALGLALPQAGAAPGIRRGGRPPALVLVAVTLLAAMSVGAVAAAAPGGPLYATRVAVEAVFLPTDPTERVAAELSRLDQRVAEAAAAARQGNENGVQAALGEYASIAAEAASIPVTDAAADRQFALRVQTQLAAIAAIGADDPALETVRVRVRAAAGTLLSALGEPPGGPGPGYPQPNATNEPSGDAGSPQPSPMASSSPGAGASNAPNTSGGPHPPASSAPTGGAPQGSGAPSAQPSAGGSGQATPRPSTGPQPSASPSPRTSADPSKAPGGNQGSPSPGSSGSGSPSGGSSSPSPGGSGSGSPSGSGSGPGPGGGSGQSVTTPVEH